MSNPTASTPQHVDDEGRVTDRLPDRIDRDSYTPALVGLVSNMLVWGGSRVFNHLFGVGTNEWRIISALGNHPGSSASELCEVLGINKSIASISINTLMERRLITGKDGKRGSRLLFLTQAGAEMHAQMMPVAMERQRILHRRLEPEEIRVLNNALRKMLDAKEDLIRYEAEVLASTPRTDPPEGDESAGA
ncbi:MarR family transcriptional regulator [Zafaria cholistanensis]|uniref:MarR family transcriptional regulator n=1 Tax=Zafaria cholistanensis TaxID=1682741 RepID=A0A5A7NR12_9MICC|nr:MarR family winged helix-turn-helix transcriptional regulator [Zafaria cholistanensis]GER23185.1 MarR family transcriptional regulator [Zafaria cholistanensis]